MKFAHLSDCHLGGWRHPELNTLNFKSFQTAFEICKKQKVDFVLIAGDLFDSPYPPIDTLKDSFNEFRKLHEAGIPVFLIAGSHDYSVSGKSFLDVLESAGLCKNVSLFEEHNNKIMLHPTIYKNVAIYGYPGRKSGLEVQDVSRIKIQDSPGLYKILMLHTTIKEAIQGLPIPSVNTDNLPKVDYVALGHLHTKFNTSNLAYAGPTFPNNISELEDLKHGSFFIIDNGIPKRQDLNLAEVFVVSIEIKNTRTATEEIIQKLNEAELEGKIVILKLHGLIAQGKVSDIDFLKIEALVKEKKSLVFLKNTSKLKFPEPDMKFDFTATENIEEDIIKKFQENNKSSFNTHVQTLIRTLQSEKLEDEKLTSFQDRILSETKKHLNL